MKKRKFLGGLAVALMFFSACLVGCRDIKEIEISVVGDEYKVTRAETLQFDAKLTNIDESELIYVVESGSATISESGLLTVDEDAEVQSTIEVFAKAGEIKSNTISVVVIDLKPTSINLSGSNDKIAKGGNVVLSISFEPTFATLKDYTLAIIEGGEYSQIIGNTLTIKQDADEEEIIDEVITVKATLTTDTTISDTFTITVVEAEAVQSIKAINLNIVAGLGATSQIKPEAYNGAGYKLNVSQDAFTFSSRSENILTIGQNTGYITTKGHGDAIVDIEYINGEKAECRVFVMVPPENLTIDSISTHINSTRTLNFSRVGAPLDLDINLPTKVGYLTSTEQYTYKFELMDDFDDVISSGDAVATIEDGKIRFKVNGRVKVTLTSDSSLNGYRVPASAEKSTSLYVQVNSGINIYTIADLVNYAKDSNAGKTANFLNNLYLDADNNFGISSNHYVELKFRGDRTLEGNGYIISLQRLPLLSGNGKIDQLLNFVAFKDTPFTVEMYDLEFKGCIDIDGKYEGDLYPDKPLLLESEEFTGSIYRRAFTIRGMEWDKTDKENWVLSSFYGNSYAKDIKLSNIEASGFDTAIRLSHVVGGYASDIRISNCYSNGIESDQNIMTFNNLEFGQLGAFGLEITPDDVKYANTLNPQPTSGINYDQQSQITISGTIKSKNYNNGASTEYMKTLPVVPIIKGIASGIIGSYNESIQEAMRIVLESCMFLPEHEDETLNLYLLLFVDFAPVYDLGNTEEKFVKYYFDTQQGQIINLAEIAENFANDATYTGYKNHKYITIDLSDGIGQLIIVNQAYEGN